jgi:hypothetical protein
MHRCGADMRGAARLSAIVATRTPTGTLLCRAAGLRSVVCGSHDLREASACMQVCRRGYLLGKLPPCFPPPALTPPYFSHTAQRTPWCPYLLVERRAAFSKPQAVRWSSRRMQWRTRCTIGSSATWHSSWRERCRRHLPATKRGTGGAGSSGAPSHSGPHDLFIRLASAGSSMLRAPQSDGWAVGAQHSGRLGVLAARTPSAAACWLTWATQMKPASDMVCHMARRLHSTAAMAALALRVALRVLTPPCPRPL